MIRDPIVEETHRVRQKMFDDCGGDRKKLCELIRAHGAVAEEPQARRQRGREKAPSTG